MKENYVNDDFYESLKITEYANREAKLILSELDMQNEKLVEIQKITGESKSLLFNTRRLIESIDKSMGYVFIFVLLVFLIALFFWYL